MRTLFRGAALGAAFLLVACEAPPTDLGDGPSLKSAFEEDMVVPWFYWEGPAPIPCANGGAGDEFLWGAELAGFGRTHDTPSGNYHEVLKVQFRDVVFRSSSGEVYPFVKVVQQNILHSLDQNGHTVVHWVDNEFYKTPDGRNVMVQYAYHLNAGDDGTPAVERMVLHCSPAKW